MKNHKIGGVKIIQEMKVIFSIRIIGKIKYLSLIAKVYIIYNHFSFKIFFNKFLSFFQTVNDIAFSIHNKSIVLK